jgi:hypothetical protein
MKVPRIFRRREILNEKVQAAVGSMQIKASKGKARRKVWVVSSTGIGYEPTSSIEATPCLVAPLHATRKPGPGNERSNERSQI